AWWFWRGNVEKRVGYAAHARSWLLTDAVPLPPGYRHQHLVVTYKMLLSVFGIPLSESAPQLYLSSEEKEDAKRLLIQESLSKSRQDGDILIGIHPGAAYGSAKCWLPDRFTALSHKLLRDERINLVFFGDQAGVPLIQGITSSLPAERV